MQEIVLQNAEKAEAASQALLLHLLKTDGLLFLQYLAATPLWSYKLDASVEKISFLIRTAGTHRNAKPFFLSK